MHVEDVGCGFANVALATGSALAGRVLDQLGRPVPRIAVRVDPRDDRSPDNPDYFVLHADTDAWGRFAIGNLPEEDIRLSAGSDYPTTEAPYARVYYPLILSLKPGDHRESIVLRLPRPLPKSSVKVQVTFKSGPLPAAIVVDALNEGDTISESAKAGADGVAAAAVPCLRGRHYGLEARTMHAKLPWRGDILRSARVPVVCGEAGGVISLTLDHEARF